MSWVAVGAAAATVVGSAIQADSSKSAANTQSAAANRATAQQLAMFNNTQRNLAPWQQSGTLALSELNRRLGLTTPASQLEGLKVGYERGGKVFDSEGNYLGRYGYGDPGGSTVGEIAPTWGVDRVISSDGTQLWSNGKQSTAAQTPSNDPLYGSLIKPFGLDDFQASPAYQFNLQQGQMAIDKAAAARGKFYAPATLQDVSKFSQGLASNEFQNAYSNYNTNLKNIWDRLYSMSGSGQNAAVQTGGFGTTVAGQVGNDIIGAGNAQAAGQVGQANAVNNGIANAYNNYTMQQILAQNQQSTVPQSRGSILPMTGAGDVNGYNA